MKNKKTNLIYFIVLIILTGVIGLFSYQEVYAKKNCDFSKDRKCDFSFGYFLISGIGGKSCRNIKATKVYDLSYRNSKNEETKMYGFCYYDPNTNGFFYEGVNSNCTSRGYAYIPVTNRHASSLVEQDTAKFVDVYDKDGKLTKADGCAPYVYLFHSDYSIQFSYDKLDDEKWFEEVQAQQASAIANGDKNANNKGATIGTTTDDNGEILEKIKACVGNEVVNGKNCNNDGTTKDIKTLTSECIDKSTPNLSTPLYDEYESTAIQYFKQENYAENLVLVCKLTKKCNAKLEDIVKYFDNKKNGGGKSFETIIRDTFPTNVEQCVIDETITKSAEVDAETNQTEEALEEGTKTGIDDSKAQRDSDFQDNNQNYYEGEKLHIANAGTIDPGSDCSAILTDETTKLFNTVLRYMQYLGPVLVVVLSTIDFIKAAASGNPDDMKKAWNRLVKRLIAAILLFFVALITRLLLSFFDITVPENCLK